MGGNPGLSKRPLSDLMLFLIKEGLIAARNIAAVFKDIIHFRLFCFETQFGPSQTC